MSKVSKAKIKCLECGKEFEIDMWESLNADLQPNLREQLVVTGEFFKHECPHCGYIQARPYPILYHDMTHKFMIYSGSLSHVMKEHKAFQEQIEKINSTFDGISRDYTYCGVVSPNELIEKIIILENGYDYRIATIYKHIFIGYFNKKTNEKMKRTLFVYDEKMNISIAGFGEEDEYLGLFGFSENVYYQLYEKYIKKVDDVFSFIFDDAIAKKLLLTDDEEIEEKKQFNTNYAVVQLENDVDVFASILPTQIKTYNEGDIVLLMTPQGFTIEGIVTMVMNMNSFEAPIKLDKCYTIISKSEGVELTTSKDSGEELDNNELREALLKYKNNEGKFPNDLVWESHAILGTKTTFSFLLQKQLENGEIELGDLLKTGKEFISPDEIVTKFEIREINDGNYLCVYLSTQEADGVSKITYRLNDLLELALFRTDCDGVVINPNSDQIIIPTPRIMKSYIYERYMSNFERMKNLLKSFDEEDIDYIIKENYDIICKVYFERKNPEQIAEELNMTRKEVGDALDFGYQYMIELLQSKYILRKRD